MAAARCLVGVSSSGYFPNPKYGPVPFMMAATHGVRAGIDTCPYIHDGTLGGLPLPVKQQPLGVWNHGYARKPACRLHNSEYKWRADWLELSAKHAI